VPIVVEAHVAIEVQRILETGSRRVPRLPMVAVDLSPTIDAARVAEAQRGPGAPVQDVGAAEIPDVVHLEARRLTNDARLEAREAAAVLAELDLRCSAGERRARRVDGELVARLLE